MYLAIDVKPAPVLTYKSAGLMQPVGATTNLVAGDKFNDGFVLALLLMAFDGQANPVERGFFVKVERRWPCAGVPGC